MRLTTAATLAQHKLILEAFHPSTKLSTPHFFCDYNGTPGLDTFDSRTDASTLRDCGDSYESEQGEQGEGVHVGQLGTLAGLYSHFTPVIPENDGTSIRRPHPAGDVPGHTGTSTWYPDELPLLAPPIPSQIMNLESHELFSQLCVITNLVKMGPKRGLFLSCVNIDEGVIRVWRDWLVERAGHTERVERDAAQGGNGRPDEKGTLWVDNRRDVGLRVRVVQRLEDGPVLLARDDDAAVSYTLFYEGMSLTSPQTKDMLMA